ncbi:hypothetical protein KBB96_20790 [Luteolibacter ambystomatis]|uniref:Uncharacterized protein n=1 Tax=Luteolibacter ambystomatis TaxID=2824561 RepID=A0A975G8Z3_9BACT|nr:hypothetical protein [Luteolibacter ambystomatis]QUE51279.1 hypothetical protein KBB96_20790 [Luteolibacter ambystomatis]
MSEDPSESKPVIIRLMGTACSMLGAVCAVICLLLVLLTGMAGAWATVLWLPMIVALLALLGSYLFCTLLLEFGLMLLRGRLPVRQEQFLPWWFCRVFAIWAGTLALPLFTAFVVRSIRLDWTAVPALAGMIGCVWAVRFLLRKSEWLILKEPDSTPPAPWSVPGDP